MSIALSQRPVAAPSPELELTADMSFPARLRLAIRDLRDGLALWRLGWILGWLDIRLRYRGSVLGPFWLTLSTAVMVGSLGVLYAKLFGMALQDYLPFMALSMVLWNTLSGLVADASGCFTQAEGVIRTVRLPFFLQPIRTVVRNALTLAHNVIVIVVVFTIFKIWPGISLILLLPAFAVWAIDGLLVCLLLGTVGARFRDVPPIIGSIMQVAFFLSPIIWKPDQVPGGAPFLPLNPFFSFIEVVRAPLLGTPLGWLTWFSVIGYSLVLAGITLLLFPRARGRLAFWV
ncbi:MAG: ABC transporter permease [Acetobacteraceae bacterium]|nr:ABC transporter permease [Acetobacteraceae bacterium]MBV8521822.1 ABC transporter permease [Acetobacteraceae bacterium]MBV8590002.1 ABC transporter permease [Acetobacteraceae bacterium]